MLSSSIISNWIRKNDHPDERKNRDVSQFFSFRIIFKFFVRFLSWSDHFWKLIIQLSVWKILVLTSRLKPEMTSPLSPAGCYLLMRVAPSIAIHQRMFTTTVRRNYRIQSRQPVDDMIKDTFMNSRNETQSIDRVDIITFKRYYEEQHNIYASWATVFESQKKQFKVQVIHKIWEISQTNH